MPLRRADGQDDLSSVDFSSIDFGGTRNNLRGQQKHDSADLSSVDFSAPEFSSRDVEVSPSRHYGKGAPSNQLSVSMQAKSVLGKLLGTTKTMLDNANHEQDGNDHEDKALQPDNSDLERKSRELFRYFARGRNNTEKHSTSNHEARATDLSSPRRVVPATNNESNRSKRLGVPDWLSPTKTAHTKRTIIPGRLSPTKRSLTTDIACYENSRSGGIIAPDHLSPTKRTVPYDTAHSDNRASPTKSAVVCITKDNKNNRNHRPSSLERMQRDDEQNRHITVKLPSPRPSSWSEGDRGRQKAIVTTDAAGRASSRSRSRKASCSEKEPSRSKHRHRSGKNSTERKLDCPERSPRKTQKESRPRSSSPRKASSSRRSGAKSPTRPSSASPRKQPNLADGASSQRTQSKHLRSPRRSVSPRKESQRSKSSHRSSPPQKSSHHRRERDSVMRDEDHSRRSRRSRRDKDRHGKDAQRSSTPASRTIGNVSDGSRRGGRQPSSENVENAVAYSKNRAKRPPSGSSLDCPYELRDRSELCISSHSNRSRGVLRKPSLAVEAGTSGLPVSSHSTPGIESNLAPSEKFDTSHSRQSRGVLKKPSLVGVDGAFPPESNPYDRLGRSNHSAPDTLRSDFVPLGICRSTHSHRSPSVRNEFSNPYLAGIVDALPGETNEGSFSSQTPSSQSKSSRSYSSRTSASSGFEAIFDTNGSFCLSRTPYGNDDEFSSICSSEEEWCGTDMKDFGL